MKYCKKCRKDLYDIKFYISKVNKDGLSTYCKKCTSKIALENYEKNKKKAKLRHAEYIKNNPEKQKQYFRNWWQKNKEEKRKANREWHISKKEQ